MGLFEDLKQEAPTKAEPGGLFESLVVGEAPTKAPVEATWGEMISAYPGALWDITKQSAAGGVMATGDLLGDEQLYKSGSELFKAADESLKANMPNLEPGSFKDMAFSAALSTGQMMPLFALGATGAGLPATLIGMSALTGARQYGEYREQGIEAGRAAIGATIYGASEGLSELLPGLKLLKRGTPFIKRLIEVGLSEVYTENINQYIQDATDYFMTNPDRNFGDFVRQHETLKSIYRTTGATLLQTLMMTAGIHPLVRRGVVHPGKEENVNRIADRVALKTKATGDAARTAAEEIVRERANNTIIDERSKSASGELSAHIQERKKKKFERREAVKVEKIVEGLTPLAKILAPEEEVTPPPAVAERPPAVEEEHVSPAARAAAAESGKYDPSNPPGVPEGQAVIQALKLENGDIYYDSSASTHIQVMERFGISSEQAAESGFIDASGKYHPYYGKPKVELLFKDTPIPAGLTDATVEAAKKHARPDQSASERLRRFFFNDMKRDIFHTAGRKGLGTFNEEYTTQLNAGKSIIESTLSAYDAVVRSSAETGPTSVRATEPTIVDPESIFTRPQYDLAWRRAQELGTFSIHSLWSEFRGTKGPEGRMGRKTIRSLVKAWVKEGKLTPEIKFEQPTGKWRTAEAQAAFEAEKAKTKRELTVEERIQPTIETEPIVEYASERERQYAAVDKATIDHVINMSRRRKKSVKFFLEDSPDAPGIRTALREAEVPESDFKEFIIYIKQRNKAMTLEDEWDLMNIESMKALDAELESTEDEDLTEDLEVAEEDVNLSEDTESIKDALTNDLETILSEAEKGTLEDEDVFEEEDLVPEKDRPYNPLTSERPPGTEVVKSSWYQTLEAAIRTSTSIAETLAARPGGKTGDPRMALQYIMANITIGYHRGQLDKGASAALETLTREFKANRNFYRTSMSSEEFSDLSDQLNEASKYVSTIASVLLETPMPAPTEAIPPSIRTITDLRNMIGYLKLMGESRTTEQNKLLEALEKELKRVAEAPTQTIHIPYPYVKMLGSLELASTSIDKTTIATAFGRLLKLETIKKTPVNAYEMLSTMRSGYLANRTKSGDFSILVIDALFDRPEIAKVLQGVPIRLHADPNKLDSQFTVAGYYRGTNSISVNVPNLHMGTGDTAVHESVHALLSHALAVNPEFRLAINSIREAVLNSLSPEMARYLRSLDTGGAFIAAVNKGTVPPELSAEIQGENSAIYYAAVNNDEFIATTLAPSNFRLQAYLASISYPGQPGRSLLSKLWYHVTKIIYGENSTVEQNNALQAVLSVTGKFLDNLTQRDATEYYKRFLAGKFASDTTSDFKYGDRVVFKPDPRKELWFSGKIYEFDPRDESYVIQYRSAAGEFNFVRVSNKEFIQKEIADPAKEALAMQFFNPLRYRTKSEDIEFKLRGNPAQKVVILGKPKDANMLFDAKLASPEFTALRLGDEEAADVFARGIDAYDLYLAKSRLAMMEYERIKNTVGLAGEEATKVAMRVEARESLDSIKASQKVKDAAKVFLDAFERYKVRYRDSQRTRLLDSMNTTEREVFRSVLMDGKSVMEALKNGNRRAREFNKRAKAGGSTERIGTATQAVMQSYFDQWSEIKDWGIMDYITHAMKGSIAILNKDGKILSVAETRPQAVQRAMRILENNPGIEELQIDTTHWFGDEPSVKLSKGQYWTLHSRMARELKKEAGIMEADIREAMTNKMLKKLVSIKPAPVWNPFLQERREILPGEENILDVLPSYFNMMEKKMAIDPFIQYFRKVVDKFSDRPVLQQMMFDQVESIRGKYGPGDRIADDVLEAFGLDTKFAWTRSVAEVRNVMASLKLGYRYVASFVNYMSGMGHIWIKTGAKYIYRAMQLKNTPEGKAFIEQYAPHLGVSFVEEATGIRTRIPLWAPLGMFQAPELPVRSTCLIANYLFAKEVHNYSDEEATEFAKRSVRVQEFDYSVAALPQIMRSPMGKLIFQFKPYLVKEIEFIRSLKGPGEWAKYLFMMAALGGPRGFMITLKSLPILALIKGDDWLDEIDQWLNVNYPRFSRGVFGYFGIDASGPASFQFPESIQEWMGITISELVRLYRDIYVPLSNGESYITEDIKKFVKGSVPVARLWGELIESRYHDGWIWDEDGNKKYQVEDWSDVARMIGGFRPLAHSVQDLEIRLTKRQEAQEKAQADKILRQFVKSREMLNVEKVVEDLVREAAVHAIQPNSIVEAIKRSEIDPSVRQVLALKVARRAEVWKRRVQMQQP